MESLVATKLRIIHKMQEIDFKQESVEFARQNGCPPALIIEAAMRHAAALVVDRIAPGIHEAYESIVKARASNVSNGDTKIIQIPPPQ